MGTPYADQLHAKQQRVAAELAAQVPDGAWRAPFASHESHFRNKAKLVVGGSAQEPTLGILGRDGAGIDLRACGLYEPGLAATFDELARFITTAGLTPYDVTTRRGELKYLIVTYSPDDELMLRFVLRSKGLLAKLRSRLPHLLESIPRLRVVTANLHPEHKAVIEGDTEVPLTDEVALPMRINGHTLMLGPQSFFQTNTAVAAGLYRQGADWLSDDASGSVWDLYCGVGGFARHLLSPGREVVGIELSADAVHNARAGLPEGARAQFHVGDATLTTDALPQPAAVVVNPPRRGIGELTGFIERRAPRTVLYSSCNPQSLARDLAALPSYAATHARLFDMFPQTSHSEVLVRLDRR
ncbi:23S rRNA (uracil(747)-C(5))-methyltransferase RlmC [Epidermidibacterium keratini]